MKTKAVQQPHKRQSLGKFIFKVTLATMIVAFIVVQVVLDIHRISENVNAINNVIGADPKAYFANHSVADLLAQFQDRKLIEWISIIPKIHVDDGKNIIENVTVSGDYSGFVAFQLSFFTTLSNLMVAGWLYYAAFRPQLEGRKGYLSPEWSNIVMTLITITMIIFNILLVPAAIAAHKFDTSVWPLIQQYGLHLIFPIAFIVYVHVFGARKVGLKPGQRQFMAAFWWKAAGLILVYAAYALIRGEMRYQADKPEATQYPYFFLQIHNPKVLGLPGVVWFFVACALIFAIMIGFGAIYNKAMVSRERKMIPTDEVVDLRQY